MGAHGVVYVTGSMCLTFGTEVLVTLSKESNCYKMFIVSCCSNKTIRRDNGLEPRIDTGNRDNLDKPLPLIINLMFLRLSCSISV